MSQLEMLRALAPELSGVTDERANIVLGIADGVISKKVFGADYDSACVLYAAHILTMQNRVEETGSAADMSVTAGDVTSEREGDLQRTYASGIGSGGTAFSRLLGKTLYGQMLLALQARHVVPVVTRM